MYTGRPELGVSRVKIALLEVQTIFGLFFQQDGTNVSGGLCSFGASIELVKKKKSEMFISLNLTLHRFSPENFVPLVRIGKSQKGLIEEKEIYKVVYYT
jgi:hypothetical protein